MSYLVLARKYRPETFDQVAGQQPIARTLQNALRTDRLAHAYLFTGPRGVGKTSLARILAKALQCERGPTPEPCGSCERCQAVAAGRDLDVVEIDGASNRGIENIRDLRERVRYAPTGGRFKVYIVDEVHQITQDAFNAFLKTLEEPPAHVVFVFATTEPSKVPETIRSRCQEFEFRRIPDAVIATQVRELCAAEGFELEEGMDLEIARRARGGLRDALSLLDQLAAYGAGKVGFEAFRELTGFVAPGRVREFVDALLEQDANQAVEWVAAALDHGSSAGDLIDQLLDYLRALLHRSSGCQRLPALPGIDESCLERQAEAWDEGLLLASLHVLLEARRHLRDVEDERLVLELTALELLRLAELPPLADALARLDGGGGTGAPRSAPAAAGTPAKAGKAPALEAGPGPSAGRPAAGRPSTPRRRETPAGESAAANLDPPQLYQRIVAALRESSPSLLPLMQAVRAVRCEDGVLWVAAREKASLPALPNARLDATLRKLGRQLIGTALVVRLDASAPERPDDSGDRRTDRREQVEGEFPGGLFVSG